MNLWGRKCSPRPTPLPSWLLPLNLFTFKVIDKYVPSDILLIVFLLFCSFSFYQFFSCFLCGLMTFKNDMLSFLFHYLFCIYYRFSVSITVRGYSQGILTLNIFSLTFKFVWCSVFVLLDLTILFFLFHELEGKPLFKDSSRKL